MVALQATVSAFAFLSDARNMQLLVVGLCLAGTLLFGAVVIALISRWRRKSDTDDLSPSAQLAQFRSLYEAGSISKEEYERLRALLGSQLRETLGVPAPASETRVKPAPGDGEPPPDNPETGIRPA